MPTKKIKTPIEPGSTYHIFNRGNNYQNVFFRQEDYNLFLEKFKLYLKNSCSVYAFALLPNHYHFLLRVNDNIGKPEFSQQYLKFILSYTNKINFRDKRNGSLFLSYFRRIKIEDDAYLKRLVYYINHNPEKHGIAENFRTYKFCSYPILISNRPSDLARDEVIDLFGGLQYLIEYHNFMHDESAISGFTIEND